MLADPVKVVNYLYYTKLPNIYREMDEKIGSPFYRYLSAIFVEGAGLALEDIEGMLKLIDPEKCPEEYLEFFCKSFGLPYYADISAKYQRKFLSNVGELLKRRGTYSCVRYLAKTLTGLDVDLEYFRGYNDDNVYGRYLYIELLAETIQQITNIDTLTSVVEKYIGLFLPYYITSVVIPVVEKMILQSNMYRRSILTVSAKQDIFPFVRNVESNLVSAYYNGTVITSSIEQIISSS